MQRARPARQTLVDLPPFLDLSDWALPRPFTRRAGAPRLLTVAMMREGDKLASYRILADALCRLPDRRGRSTSSVTARRAARSKSFFAAWANASSFHGAVDDRPGFADVLCAGRPLRLAGRERGLRHGASRGAGVRLPRRRGRLWRRRERRRDGQTGILARAGRCRRASPTRSPTPRRSTGAPDAWARRRRASSGEERSAAVAALAAARCARAAHLDEESARDAAASSSSSRISSGAGHLTRAAALARAFARAGHETTLVSGGMPRRPSSARTVNFVQLAARADRGTDFRTLLDERGRARHAGLSRATARASARSARDGAAGHPHHGAVSVRPPRPRRRVPGAPDARSRDDAAAA